jgi:hypothetical protein
MVYNVDRAVGRIVDALKTKAMHAIAMMCIWGAASS